MLTDGIAFKQKTHFRINHMNFIITVLLYAKTNAKNYFIWKIGKTLIKIIYDLFKSCYLDKTKYSVENLQTTGLAKFLNLLSNLMTLGKNYSNIFYCKLYNKVSGFESLFFLARLQL